MFTCEINFFRFYAVIAWHFWIVWLHLKLAVIVAYVKKKLLRSPADTAVQRRTRPPWMRENSQDLSDLKTWNYEAGLSFWYFFKVPLLPKSVKEIKYGTRISSIEISHQCSQIPNITTSIKRLVFLKFLLRFQKTVVATFQHTSDGTVQSS